MELPPIDNKKAREIWDAMNEAGMDPIKASNNPTPLLSAATRQFVTGAMSRAGYVRCLSNLVIFNPSWKQTTPFRMTVTTVAIGGHPVQ